MSGILRCCVIALALSGLACAVIDTRPAPEAPSPPRVSLGDWTTIGIVTFEGEVDGELASQATRRFVEMVHAAQPDARIVELGSRGAVLSEVGRDALDFEATRAVGQRFGVDAVFTGVLELANARPRVSLGESDSSLRAGMDVSGELAARLTETASGALVWSRSASGMANVANVGLRAGVPSFGGQTPEEARSGLVVHLVSELRHDFHPTSR